MKIANVLFMGMISFPNPIDKNKLNLVNQNFIQNQLLAKYFLDPGKTTLNKKGAQRTLKKLWITLPLHSSGGTNYVQPEHTCVK